MRYIVAGSLIDGSGGAIRRKCFLAVNDGIISEIGSLQDFAPDPGVEIEDLSHCVILPPLVDCSVFLTRSPSVMQKPESSSGTDNDDAKAALLERHISDCHMHGVLGLVENDEISGLLERIDRKTVAERLAHLKIAHDSRNSDILRVAYSPGIDESGPTTLQLDRESLTRLLYDRGDRKSVVVANGPRRVSEALDAGCDAIEQGYDMGEDNLEKMAAKEILWIPSIVRAKNGLDGSSSGGSVCCRFSQRYVAPGTVVPGAESFWKKTLSGQLAQLRLARKLGVTVAIGTGAGHPGLLHGESMVEEMKLFAKAGYPLEEIMRCASKNPAAFFKMDHLGSLQIGRKATFLVVRGSTGQLPRKLSYLEGIIINGLPSPSYRKNPIKAV